jgi:hypothetical protein
MHQIESITRIESMKAPNGLYDKVMQKINEEVYKRARFSFVMYRAALSLSVIVCFCTGIWLYRDLVGSGFIESAKLAISDSAAILVYWREFTSSLVEMLPFASLCASLAAVLVFLGTLTKYYESSFFTYKKI